MARSRYVSIDLETTGLDPHWCQILEVGAVIDDWTGPLEKLPYFHCYVVHERIVGDPYALAMNHEILRRIANRNKPENKQYLFLTPDRVGPQLEMWARGCGVINDEEKSILAAGKNFAGFDRPFLQRLPNFDLTFKHRNIDPGMLYWNPDTDKVPPSSKDCMDRAGIQGEVAHTAVEDALGVIKMVRARFPNTVTAGIDVASGISITINGGAPPLATAKSIAEKMAKHFTDNGQMG